MPKETFFNLPPAKREKLVEAAVNEFARKSCAEASINRIIQAAEIPRGSFYQYFSGKTDLFQYVLCRYEEQIAALTLQGLEHCVGKLLELPPGRAMALSDTIQIVLEWADWSGLSTESPEERLCLLELLFSSVRRTLMGVFCGKLTPEEGRQQLSIKTALIHRGVEK